jgi:capsid portal protein
MSDVVRDNENEIDVLASGDIFGNAQEDSIDPFLMSAEDVHKLNGFSANAKRRNTRQIQKFQRGADGTESKKNETEVLMGYDITATITPPYNLDYLAKIYEVSSPHFAAITAKASNIVGLGYEFMETRQTKERMYELSDNEDALARFRRKLERAK